jgi:polar amino acid transport system substrate-binding protein
MDRRMAGLGLLALGLATQGTAAPLELRMGYTASWTMPWGRLQGERVVEGIHHDIGQALARRLGWQLVFRRVPQQRSGASAEHARRFADFGCGMHPSWFPQPEHYHWSEPLFDVGDQLVGHRDTPAPADLAALPRGTRVGTVRSYHYPSLQARFASGELIREDAPDQASALRKLMLRRTEVAVLSPQVLDWTLRQQPGAPLAAWRLTVQAAGYHCAVLRGTAIDAQAVLAALHALQREGEIARILARYAPP